MNRRFLTVLGIAAVLALVVSAIFYQITTTTSGPRRANLQTQNVVVATNPVPLGTAVKATDLKVVAWPVSNVPPGTFTQIDEVADRVAMSGILAEEPILDGRLAARGAGVGLSPIIPSGMRAVSVRVNDVISVAGFVLPGSRVDIIVTGVPRDAAGENGPVTRTILSNIQVVSAGKNIQPDAKGQPDNVPVVTLLVNPEQAEILTLASGEGRIQLSLRNNTDKTEIAGPGVSIREIFTGKKIAAVPQPAAGRPRVSVVPRSAVPSAAIAVAPVPPPPAPPQIEVIRGDKRSTEVVRFGER